jgi:hypothetical protein
MTTFQHSGNLGDIIWGLPIMEQFGGGDLTLIPDNIPTVIRKYNNGPVFPEYEGRLSQKDYEMIAPLLEAQPYIYKLTFEKDKPCNVDLDKFRGTVGQAFKKNFLETYAETFDLSIHTGAWLTVPNPKRIAPIVVTRTARYHSPNANVISNWEQLIKANNIPNNGVFVGLPDEHKAFEELFDITIQYHPIKNFLDLAEVIAGADAYIGNQTFAYSVARGLDKTTLLELRSVDCYIEKENCHYF